MIIVAVGDTAYAIPARMMGLMRIREVHPP